MLEQAAAENPDHPEVYLTNAQLAMNERRVIDAILNSDKVLQYAALDRWNAEQKKRFQTSARSNLVAAYESRGEWAAMRTHLNALLELDKTGQLRVRLAKALFFLDKPDDALVELTQAVKDDPLLESPTVQMARLWTMKGDNKKAREWFDKSIKAESNSLRVHLAYADWLLQQNEIEQAKIHCDTAEKIDTNSVDVLKLKGLIARIQRDLGTAERIFRKCVNDSPDDLFASNQLALVLVDQTDKEARSKGLKQAQVNASANSKNADALSTYAYALYRTGNMEEAGKFLQSIMQATNGQMSADMAYYTSLILNERDKSDDAKTILEGALKTKGLFVYRKEAQQLFDRLSKEKPKDAKTK